MYCGKCGQKLTGKEKFCPKCGSQMVITERRTHKKKKTGLIIVIFLLFIIVLGMISYFLIKETEQKRIEKQQKAYAQEMEKANQYFGKKDYSNAEKGYSSALEVKDDESEPYLKLAQIYAYQNNMEKAVDILQKGKEICSGTKEIEEKLDLYTYVDDVLVSEEGRCQEGEYKCGYRTKIDMELESVQSQRGVITYRIKDFDRDGREELLVLMMRSREEVKEVSDTNTFNVVYLQMYEAQSGEVVLQDEYRGLYPVLGNGEVEWSGLFIKEGNEGCYICGSSYQSRFLIYDMRWLNSFVLYYDGIKFVQKAGTEGVINITLNDLEKEKNEMIAFLNEIGLNKEASRMRENDLMRFEFVDDNIELLFEITGEWKPKESTNDSLREAIDRFFETTDAEELGNVMFKMETY